MARLKFSEDLFVDNLELQRLSKFIFEDGWEEALKQNTGSFGIIKNKLDVDFLNFKVTQGSPIGSDPTINVADGHIIGYDSTLKKLLTLKNKDRQPIIFPQDGKWYWVKVSPATTTLETGKVTIDTAGNLIGSGTKFTEVLRGQPNFPSTIRFYAIDKTDNLTILPSALNSVEYEVVQVIDDTHAVLAGDFINESDLYYDVIGSFTPGYTVPTGDKGVFRYDSCDISLVEEVSITGAPLKPAHSKDYDFMIYRIKFDSNQMFIQDYRNELFKFKGEFEVEYVQNRAIPNIGISSATFEADETTKENSIVRVEWGFKSSSYTVSTGEEKINILSGSGGKFKTPNDFTDNDWDGYKLYVIDGVRNILDDDYYSNFEKFFKILSSKKNGTSIDLMVENFSPLDFIPLDYSSAQNYKNGDIVNTVNGSYRLSVALSTAISPIQSAYNSGTTYSVNQFVSFGDSTWRSLQNSNTNHQPDTSPTYWQRHWKQSKPEILIVPNCEEILLSVKVGDDVDSITDKEKYAKEYSFSTIFGGGDISLVGINSQNGVDVNNLVYNIKYRQRNNKAYSSKLVLPTDNVGYVNELGNTTPYDTSFVENAFIKAIRSSDSYLDFKNRVDLGANVGWEEITDLEPYVAGFALRVIPINIGVNKQRIIVKSSTPITADLTFDIDVTDVKGGNEFEIQFLSKILNTTGAPNSKIIIKTGLTTFNLEKDRLRRGNQLVRLKYDSDSAAWNMILEDNSFNGNNHFEPGFEIIQTSQPGTTSISTDGKRVLIVEGDYNSIAVNDDAGNNSIPFGYIEFKNNKIINELHLSTHSASPVNLILACDGVDAYDTTPSGVVGRYNFMSSPKSNVIDKTNGAAQHEIGLGEKVYFVFGTLNNSATNKQGYKIISRSLWGISTVPFIKLIQPGNLSTSAPNASTKTISSSVINVSIPYSSVKRKLLFTIKADFTLSGNQPNGDAFCSMITAITGAQVSNPVTTSSTARLTPHLNSNNSDGTVAIYGGVLTDIFEVDVIENGSSFSYQLTLQFNEFYSGLLNSINMGIVAVPFNNC